MTARELILEWRRYLAEWLLGIVMRLYPLATPKDAAFVGALLQALEMAMKAEGP